MLAEVPIFFTRYTSVFAYISNQRYLLAIFVMFYQKAAMPCIMHSTWYFLM